MPDPLILSSGRAYVGDAYILPDRLGHSSVVAKLAGGRNARTLEH